MTSMRILHQGNKQKCLLIVQGEAYYRYCIEGQRQELIVSSNRSKRKLWVQIDKNFRSSNLHSNVREQAQLKD